VNPQTSARLSPRERTAIELAAIALALIALTALVLRITNGGVLFWRPFWVDEWFTVLVARQRSPADVIGHLRHGADGGASLYHLLVWGVHAITGSVTPVALRALSMVCVWGALWFSYAVLRRRFGPDASIVGALAVGSHGLVVAHAFEGRFYGLWLLCGAVFAWSIATEPRPSRARQVALALASVLLVTSHWYGIFTLGLMCAAAVLVDARRWRDALRALAPALAGVVVFVAILPLAAGQRKAVTVDSWIPAFEFGQLSALSGTFWWARVPLAAIVVIAGAWILSRGRPARTRTLMEPLAAFADPAIAALLSLAAMPLVLTVLSLAGQPSMISRYAIPAVLAWGPLMAGAVAIMGRWHARVAAVVLVGFWLVSFTREAGRKRAFAAGIAQERSAVVAAVKTGLPLVFQSQHTMYPAVGPELILGRRDVESRWRVAFLDLPDSTLNVLFTPLSRWYQLNKGIRLERDFARVHAARFGFPPLASQQSLDTTGRFLFVASDSRLPRGVDDVTALARATFPRHLVTRLSENLLLLERADAHSLPARSTSR
jgi:hypothetical protein